MQAALYTSSVDKLRDLLLGDDWGLVDIRWPMRELVRVDRNGDLPLLREPRAYELKLTMSAVEFSAMTKDTLVLLKAPTGFGKTTRLPFILAQFIPIVVVVQPKHLLAWATYSFVKQTHPDSTFMYEPGVEFKEGVTYIGGTHFLAEIVTRPPSGIIIILDESHTKTAEYSAINAWAASQRDCVVVLTSATHGSTSGQQREDGITIVREPIDPPLDDLQFVLTEGRFSRTYVQSRVLLFVPSEDLIHTAAEIYKRHGVPYYVAPKTMNPRDFQSLILFLSDTRPKVVITCELFSYGYTIPVDEVWDFTLETDYVYDHTNRQVRTVVRPCDLSKVAQRAGRVGRMKTGKYVYMRRKFPKQDMHLSHNEYQRYYAFTRILGYTLDPTSRRRVTIGTIGLPAAAFIASVKLAADVARKYFTLTGHVYANFSPIIDAVIPQSPKSTDWLDFGVTGWDNFTFFQGESVTVQVPIRELSRDFNLYVSMSWIMSKQVPRSNVNLVSNTHDTLYFPVVPLDYPGVSSLEHRIPVAKPQPIITKADPVKPVLEKPQRVQSFLVSPPDVSQLGHITEFIQPKGENGRSRPVASSLLIEVIRGNVLLENMTRLDVLTVVYQFANFWNAFMVESYIHSMKKPVFLFEYLYHRKAEKLARTYQRLKALRGKLATLGYEYERMKYAFTGLEEARKARVSYGF